MPTIKTRKVYTLDILPESEELNRDDSYLSEHVVYDPRGLPILEESWDASGHLTERYKREYDESGRLSREILMQDGDDVLEDRHFEYDAGGKLLRETRKYQDSSISVVEYNRDTNGNLVLMLCSDEEGEEEFREESGYDANGNKLWERRLEYGELVWKREWTLDSEQRVLRFSETEMAFEMTTEHVFEYGERGEVEEERVYRNSKLHSIRRQEIDEGGAVKRTITESPQGYEVIGITYDEAGNPISQEATGRGGEFHHSVERSFDPDGNILSSRVEMLDPGTGATRGYALWHEYEFFKD